MKLAKGLRAAILSADKGLMGRITEAFRHHPLVFSAFVLALALTLFFAARTIGFAIYWSDPTRREVPIQGWMTPRYVAYSWDLPREAMTSALGGVPDTRGQTLADIAEQQGIALEDLIERIESEIAAAREVAPQ